MNLDTEWTVSHYQQYSDAFVCVACLFVYKRKRVLYNWALYGSGVQYF